MRRIFPPWGQTARLTNPGGGVRRGSVIRNACGFALIAVGLAGLVLPIIPGIPLLAAGAALLGANHPFIRSCREWLRNKGLWREKNTPAGQAGDTR